MTIKHPERLEYLPMPLRIITVVSGHFPFLLITGLFIANMLEGISVLSLMSVLIFIYEPGVFEDSKVPKLILSYLVFDETKPSLIIAFGLVFLLLISKAVISFFVFSHVRWKTQRVANALRTQLITNMMRARWGYFTKTSSGNIISGVNTEAQRAADSYLNSAYYISEGLRITFYLVIALLVSWYLAIIAFLLCGVAFFALRYLITLSKKAGQKQVLRTAELVTMMGHTLDAIKPIKSMAREKHFHNLMQSRLDRVNAAGRTLALAMTGREQSEILFFSIAIIIVIYTLSVIFAAPLTHMMTLAFVLFRFFTNFNQLQNFRQRVASDENAFTILQERIHHAAEHAEEEKPGLQHPTLNKACCLEQVCFGYDDKQLLNHIDMIIPAHQLTVLIGPSGAGKTTTADLITGLYNPDLGKITLDGVSLDMISRSAWRRKIGYVTQDAILFEGTVRANISLGADDIRDDIIWQALRDAEIARFIETFPDGLDALISEKGRSLSGGQKQRLSLARALVGSPDLLILDEVTSALDPVAEQAICDNIRRLAKTYTILSITHKPIWFNCADRIYYLDQGKAHLVEKSAEKEKLSMDIAGFQMPQ